MFTGLTGQTDWVCYIGTVMPCVKAVAWSCIIVTWWSGSGGIQAWSFTTIWFPSVLWHCWFGHLACKNRPWNDLWCVEWDVKPLHYDHIVLQSLNRVSGTICRRLCKLCLSLLDSSTADIIILLGLHHMTNHGYVRKKIILK